MRKVLSAALFATGLFAHAAAAGQCGYINCWGAVGIGPQGAWGFSHSYAYEGDAISRVQGECPNCNVINTFYNSCGAMAVASNGGYGFAWAGSRYEAERAALGYCRDYGPNCKNVVWSCSP